MAESPINPEEPAEEKKEETGRTELLGDKGTRIFIRSHGGLAGIAGASDEEIWRKAMGLPPKKETPTEPTG